MQSVHQAIMNNVVSPMAATARTLFESHTVGEHEQPATQGNSAGQVNSPKVRSESYHQCGICDKSYQSKEEVMNHVKETHDKAKAADLNDVLFEDENIDDNEVLEVVRRMEDEVAAKEVARVERSEEVEVMVNLAVEQLYDTVMNKGGNS